jgi:biotin carboxyl carrier protein
MKLEAIVDGETKQILLEEREGLYAIALGDHDVTTINARRVEEDVWSLIIDGRSYEATVQPIHNKLRITVGGVSWDIDVYNPLRRYTQTAETHVAEGGQVISSPMPGRVVRVEVAVGDKVEAGQGVVIVEAMKMENELRAAGPGIVKEIEVEAGQAVEDGQPLVIIE